MPNSKNENQLPSRKEPIRSTPTKTRNSFAYQSVDFILTYKCNLSCRYCLRRANQSGEELSLSNIEKVLDLADSLNCGKNTCLTGGEAILHSEFFKVLECLKQRKRKAFIESNGKEINRDFIRNVKSIFKEEDVSFLISLDSLKREKHDSARGSGSYVKAMDAIRSLVANGLRVVVNVVVHRNNLFYGKDILEMVNFLEKEGVQRLCFSPVVSMGKNKENLFSLSIPQFFVFKSHSQIFLNSPLAKNRRIELSFSAVKEIYNCRRIKTPSITVSPRGFHPCLYLDDLVLETLSSGLENKKSGQKDYFPYLKIATSISENSLTGECWECVSKMERFIKKIAY